MLALSAMTLTAGAQATGSKAEPLTVTEFIEQGTPASAVADTYVQGYIVGFVDGANLSTGAHFDLNDKTVTVSNTNILLAASSSETNVEYCIPVALPTGNIRNALSLAQHPENIYHEVILCGSHEKYFGGNGLKAVSSYEWVGEAPDPGTVTPPTAAETGSKDAPLSVTKFLELGTPLAAVPNTWVSGIIVGSVTDKSLESAELGVSASSSKTNILIAATANPTSVNECIPVQLPVGDLRNALNLNENPGNLGKTIVLCGSREAYFGVAGLKTPTEYILDGETPDPVVPEGQFYKGLVNNCDDWNLDKDGEIPEGLTYVWTWDSKYTCLKGSAYVQKAYDADIYAISPVIDLTNAVEATLEFDQATNYLNGDLQAFSINIREENGAWEMLGNPSADTDKFKFVKTSYDLKSYVGKKVEVGFRYTSTAAGAGTWEIKNFTVTGKTDMSSVEAVAAEAVYTLNGNIIAPEGARAFNLSGVETGLNNLPAGIYVVVVAEKAVKVIVK